MSRVPLKPPALSRTAKQIIRERLQRSVDNLPRDQQMRLDNNAALLRGFVEAIPDTGFEIKHVGRVENGEYVMAVRPDHSETYLVALHDASHAVTTVRVAGSVDADQQIMIVARMIAIQRSHLRLPVWFRPPMAASVTSTPMGPDEMIAVLEGDLEALQEIGGRLDGAPPGLDLSPNQWQKVGVRGSTWYNNQFQIQFSPQAGGVYVLDVFNAKGGHIGSFYMSQQPTPEQANVIADQAVGMTKSAQRYSRTPLLEGEPDPFALPEQIRKAEAQGRYPTPAEVIQGFNEGKPYSSRMPEPHDPAEPFAHGLAALPADTRRPSKIFG